MTRRATRGGQTHGHAGATPPAKPRLLAVGATAQDVAPLTELLDALAVLPGWAVVVVTYDAKPLPEPVARRLIAAHHGLALDPGHAYLLPAGGAHVLQAGAFAKVRGRRGATAQAVFRAIAQFAGPRAVAVLLSGGAVAAVEGVRALKAAGGTTLVQEPTTARFDALPRAAIAAGLADGVLTVTLIASELSRLMLGDEPNGSIVEAGELSRPPGDDGPGSPELPVKRILSLVKGRYGVDLSQYKATTLKRRIERRMMAEGLQDVRAFVEHLYTSPAALKALHDELFIHVTQFFRDPRAFTALRTRVIDPLLKEGSKGGGPLRVWVPGCSTGEEAYSLCMAFAEAAQERELPLELQLFATDISDAAIHHARQAVYPDAALEAVSDARKELFFERAPAGFKVKKAIRDLCVFSRHDVTAHPPIARVDLISCRNVLIYFDSDLQQRIVPTLHYALKPGRFLWLGHSESPGASSKLFTLVDRAHKIYARAGAPVISRVPVAAFGERRGPLLAPPGTRAVPDLNRNADEVVLVRYGPPGVVVDHNLEIVRFRGRTAPYLSPPAGAPTNSLTKMAHPDLLPVLRRLLQAARRDNAPVREDRVTVGSEGEGHALAVDVTPLNPMAATHERQYLVMFEPRGGGRPGAAASAPVAQERRGAGKKGAKGDYVERLEQELDALREQQQSLAEQFQSSQEELTSANEEMQATNEELKSTNEELETAKEELQVANEELTSVNDELHARNAELLAANEKLVRGEDRFRMLVESVKDYAIYMLDPQGHVTSWNEGALRMKGYEAAEIVGQHFSRFFTPEAIAAGAPESELERARVDGRFDVEGWRLRKDGTRFWAGVVISRVNDSTGTLIGFAKVTRDLTERSKAAQELERTERRFRLMISQVKDYAIFMLDPEGRVASWNEGARRLKGYEADEIIGRHVSIFHPKEDVERGGVQRELDLALREGRMEDEGWRVRKDGSRFWANVVITRIDDPEGGVLGFGKVTRDLTETRRAQEALKAANENLERRVAERTGELETALQARDEFLSIASHELKTPLTGLKLQLQLSRRGLATGRHASPADLRESTERSLTQAVALEELVEDLLDVSRSQTGRFVLDLQPLNVAELVDEVVARFKVQLDRANMPLELHVDRALCARWDRRRIAQVMSNLLSNALKYAARHPLKISATRSPRGVELCVQDHGKGIAADKLALVFQRFERAGASVNIGGLGLGLFISRRIVEAHGGTIRVESAPGAGATFIIELPLESP